MDERDRYYDPEKGWIEPETVPWLRDRIGLIGCGCAAAIIPIAILTALAPYFF